MDCNWADNIPIQIRIEENVIIGKSCLLPFGWTAGTFLGSHTSRPYNPDIAGVFYRAGYIESRGRGIQKICSAWEEIGTELPEYIVHGENIMVKFRAIKSGIISDLKTPNRHDVGLEKQILAIMADDSTVTLNAFSNDLNVTQRTVERIVRKLREEGLVERIGGKRYGSWKVRAEK